MLKFCFLNEKNFAETFISQNFYITKFYKQKGAPREIQSLLRCADNKLTQGFFRRFEFWQLPETIHSE